ISRSNAPGVRAITAVTSSWSSLMGRWIPSGSRRLQLTRETPSWRPLRPGCNRSRPAPVHRIERAFPPAPTEQAMQGFEFLIPIVLFVCVTMAIKFVVDSRVRKRMVENNVSEDMIKSILAADERTRRLSALKWGLVLASVGFAFGLVDLLHLSFDEGHTG